MKMTDPVEVIVEKNVYAKAGVHRGMQGWICDNSAIEGCWLVNFPQYGEKEDIATISIHEEDLKEIPVMYAAVNEQIKARFDQLGHGTASAGDGISDFLI